MKHLLSRQELLGGKYQRAKKDQYPVIHVGTRGRAAPHKTHDVVIRDCVVNGNREKTSSDSEGEMSMFGTHIRLNGISLRYARKVLIEDCVIENCRSGGIVPAFCEDIVIRRCILRNNHFDGIAPYACKHIRIEQCTFQDNGYAAISIDGGCDDIVIKDCEFKKATRPPGRVTHKVWVCQGTGVQVSHGNKREEDVITYQCIPTTTGNKKKEKKSIKKKTF